MHMISYFTNGRMQAKVCSCDTCLHGNFVSCGNGRGIMIAGDFVDEEDMESDDSEPDEDECDDVEDHLEEYELRSDSILAIIRIGNIIALFSPPSSFELFYLCKVVNFGVAQIELKDEYDHVILDGQSFIQCQYLEKVGEN